MKRLLSLALLIFLAGCHTQTMYHWHKPNTGMPRFVQDHNACLCAADIFPWSSPQWLNATNLNNTRLKANRTNGIWASYVPYKGAQPVYVNSFMNDSTMIRPIYATCMENRGYRQAYTRTKSTELGYLDCDSISCQSGKNE